MLLFGNIQQSNPCGVVCVCVSEWEGTLNQCSVSLSSPAICSSTSTHCTHAPLSNEKARHSFLNHPAAFRAQAFKMSCYLLPQTPRCCRLFGWNLNDCIHRKWQQCVVYVSSAGIRVSDGWRAWVFLGSGPRGARWLQLTQLSVC